MSYSIDYTIDGTRFLGADFTVADPVPLLPAAGQITITASGLELEALLHGLYVFHEMFAAGEPMPRRADDYRVRREDGSV